MTSICRLAGWAAVALLAAAVSLSSFRYLLADVSLAPLELRANMAALPGWFVTHAAAAAIALLVLPWQLSRRARRRGRLHRLLGRAYGAAVFVGGIAAVPLALGSWAGPIATAGFLMLATAWIVTTAAGMREARCGRVDAHRRWMVRSAALTCSALTLRLYLPVPELVGVEYIAGYRAIAWLCWLPNLAIAEWWLRSTEQVTSGMAAARGREAPA
jgi:uncharacterized membrane protein